MSSRWRVQAHWTVGNDKKSYAPVFKTTREAAEVTAKEMRRTLSHFPTLDVRISEVEESRAIEEEAEIAARQASSLNEWVHLRSEKQPSLTECGLQASATNWADKSMWTLVASDRRCPACSAARLA